jgi:ankyrin repeat protein
VNYSYWKISTEHPVAVAAVAAVQTGDVDSLRRLLREHPGLATARIGPLDTPDSPAVPDAPVPVDSPAPPDPPRTLLHFATDWPGYFPNGPQTVAALVAAGADVNALRGPLGWEAPLHGAAGSGDLSVLDALLDAGAAVNGPEESPGMFAPLGDAVVWGQWEAARRLIERGASVNLWQAAALGMIGRVEELFARKPPPEPDEVDTAFWWACQGGQRVTAEYVLGQRADWNRVVHDGLTPLDAARRSGADAVVEWLRSQGAKSAEELA